jgi:tryptophanyl-tRNA synthetase
MTKRVLSGIQPTGRPHWGNYFGAIRQYIELQEENDGYYFVANLHALTTVRDRDLLAQYTWEAAIDLLALGLDPDQAVLFVQSDVPEVSELYWVLASGTPMGLMERCVAFKDKVSKGLGASLGLFTYPVLQAADILAYDSHLVPVGEDQVQHIEVCRDIAGSFNHQFGEVFVLPEARVLSSSARVPGTNGDKMSKSYDNTIEIFEEPKPMRKQVMRIQTDSRPLEEPKDPDTDHLYQLCQLFLGPEDIEELAALYRRGGFGYGEIKKKLADAADAFWQPARDRRTELLAHPDEVRDILAAGALKARLKASEVLERAQAATGISDPRRTAVQRGMLTNP